ncbi:hypothetical protein IW261DRAFT_1426988 [Armillaria novae-zelandiae]|uniref:Heterokaryon incompatibility domain-containing protein n=1 Tax=Armillaria novae-zelandiae TaxID=153914 RepID=A0AA39TTD2_9AGAR|nr:hypothetical protein IW261DRAFT_1426988 [Armillaria novae-zelandiae]
MTALSSIHGVTRFRPMALWIDTLCIPVAPHLKEYHKLAIRLLDQTFYDVKSVLVLNRELCSVESQKVSELELGIRIISDGWVKDLWTLQEAALNIESKSSLGKIICHQDLGSNKPTALASTVQEIKEGLLFGLWVEDSIISRLPSNCTTSKSEDEASLASLASLDLSNILSVQTAEERMQQFYLLLCEIPAAIILVKLLILTTPDHIPTPNMKNGPLLRWAPRSLLLHLTEVMNRFAEVDYCLNGICEPDGSVHIEREGFVFRPDDTMLYPACVFEDVNNKEQYCLTWYGTATDSFHQEVALIFETTTCSKVVIVRIEKHCGHENARTEL